MSMMRTRWAAIGAAVAVTLGAGGVGLVSATKNSGERSVYTPIEPCRVLDTRPNQGVGGRTAPLGPGEVYEIDLLQNDDQCTGIPTDLTGVGLNVTALFATELTDIRFWAEGDPPNAAHLNPAPGQPPTPNAVTTEVANDETFQVRNQAGSVHIIIDLVGLYQNHRHDDRYYTKPQSNNRFEPKVTDVAVMPFDFVQPGNWIVDTTSIRHTSTTYGCADAAVKLPAGRTVARMVARYRNFGGTDLVEIELARSDWSRTTVVTEVITDTTTEFPVYPNEFGGTEREIDVTGTAVTVADDGYVLTMCTDDIIEIFDIAIELS